MERQFGPKLASGVERDAQLLLPVGQDRFHPGVALSDLAVPRMSFWITRRRSVSPATYARSAALLSRFQRSTKRSARKPGSVRTSLSSPTSSLAWVRMTLFASG